MAVTKYTLVCRIAAGLKLNKRKYNGITTSIIQAHVEGVDLGEFCHSLNSVLYAVCLQNQTRVQGRPYPACKNRDFTVGLKIYRENRICPASLYNSGYNMKVNRLNTTIA